MVTAAPGRVQPRCHVSVVLGDPHAVSVCVSVRTGVCPQDAVVQYEWMFILTPAMTGAAILVVMAVLGHNLTGVRRYPKYWW